MIFKHETMRHKLNVENKANKPHITIPEMCSRHAMLNAEAMQSKDSNLFSSFLQLTQWHAVRLRECASIFNHRSSYTGTQKAEFFEKHQGCSEMKSEGGDYVDS